MAFIILRMIYYVLAGLILVNVILSWIPSAQWHPLGRLLLRITEPLLKPFRRLLPPVSVSGYVGIDFSPILCLAVLFVAYHIAAVIIAKF